MDFNELREINDEIEQISKTYEIFNEDMRLKRTKAARVEFLTTIRYIEKYISPNSKILDIGAGAGEYSLYFAEQGREVHSLELADENIKAFRNKILPTHNISLVQGNATNLSMYNDNEFDIVLLFGPLYHLHNETDKQKCITEAKRVLKDDGVMFFAFISHDMIPFTELAYDTNFFKSDSYNHETFRLEDFPFVFSTVTECRKMLCAGNVSIIKEIASDGISELLADKINKLDDYSYAQYLKYHFYCCEKPDLLGHSNHLLFIGKKQA